MKYLKALLLICSMFTLVAAFACGDNDDPYNSSRPVNDFENNDYSSWNPPTPGTGTSPSNNSGGPDNNNDDPSSDPSTLLKDLDQPQINLLCARTYEHYKNHDNPALPEGRGACLDFAARSAGKGAFDPESRYSVCEDTLLDCLSFTNQDPKTESCVNPRAQVNCDATIEEFEGCASQDAIILTSYFLQLQNHTCTDYLTDYNLEQLDVLLDNYPQPQHCHTLLTKCPQIFD